MVTRSSAAFVAAALASAVALCSCGGTTPSSPSDPGGIPPVATSVKIVAAGDVGECGFGAAKTGALLDTLPGTFLLVLGDLAYMQGSTANFRDCYDPHWGRQMDRTKPVPGNHEYDTPGAAGYFQYFGSRAGQQGAGYYAFTAGAWRIIALNSEIPATPGSPQSQWLHNELENNRTQCTLAYWHRPLFTSGPNGPQNAAGDAPLNLWRVLLENNVDVVLNGHDHIYERFAPQDAEGRPSANGIRQFTAGTGGAHLYAIGVPKPNSEVRASVYGILTMTLHPGSYQWDFISVDQTFRDANSGTCH